MPPVDVGTATEMLCFALDVTERNELRRRVLEASDLERRRLAHELHDGSVRPSPASPSGSRASAGHCRSAAGRRRRTSGSSARPSATRARAAMRSCTASRRRPRGGDRESARAATAGIARAAGGRDPFGGRADAAAQEPRAPLPDRARVGEQRVEAFDGESHHGDARCDRLRHQGRGRRQWRRLRSERRSRHRRWPRVPRGTLVMRCAAASSSSGQCGEAWPSPAGARRRSSPRST